MHPYVPVSTLINRLIQHTSSRGKMAASIEQERGKLLELCSLIAMCHPLPFGRPQLGISYSILGDRRSSWRTVANRNFDGEAQGRQILLEELLEELSHSTDVLDGDPGDTGVLTPKDM